MASPKQQRIDPKTVPAPKKAPAKKPASGKSGRPGGRPPGVAPVKKATLGDWIGAARPFTLPLSIAPVAAGTGIAYLVTLGEGGPGWHWLRALACLAVAVSLQIGVNFANDYSDGVRGTDKHRSGPRRLTASGAAKPRTVLAVALVFFALAAVAGAIITIRTEQWWLFAVGAAAIVAAWFYTGGKRPYGYYALGELFVFVFFGLVATVGTTYVIAFQLPLDAWLAGTAIGLIACAALMVGNIRDREQDKLAGKRTLAVLMGDRASRIVFTVLILVPFGILVYFHLLYLNAYLVFFALLAAVPAAVITLFAKTPGELVIALRLTGLTALVYGVGVGWAVGF
ncbi:1,4-dihydroxy-2-naphthoate polyprenyltransferase [Antiquaquibacter soli]|uniref:1,4-dihydroxy-2-naphthoate octaprenyltransferase n=1 Tax=Antiquaquibacter soli TaxID=3064523 RepID=A0ABT9BIM3_9MICO|nr:1,4-dihydroxy-2-naphthoate polyprenyltransferase [Protaetiibacter sp. WY-16]MDO7880874.1 1,4-dihydroxy-2-naphthoate polyprenyltransferase [Protaetiibacter sp. WY-16]